MKTLPSTLRQAGRALRTFIRRSLANHLPSSAKQFVRRARRRAERLRHWRRPPGILFTFAGRTEYWPGAGRELYAHEPVFRAAIQECERITVQTLGGPSLRRLFEGEQQPDFSKDEATLMHTSTVMQLALVELWRARGIQPDAALGISLGEIAAVYAAGGLSLEDALRVSASYYIFSRLEEPDQGLLSVEAGFAVLSPLIGRCPVALSIILVMTPERCFVSCLEADMDVATSYLNAHGVRSRPLRSVRFRRYHTTQAARHLAALREPLRALQPRPLTLPCYLTTVGRLVPAGTLLSTDHWLDLVCYPAQAHGALMGALADGYRLLVPIGGNPFPFFTQEDFIRWLGRARLLPPMRPGVSETQWLEEIGREFPAGHRNSLPPSTSLPLSATTVANQIDLTNADFVSDPYPSFAFLARHGGVHYLPRVNSWLVIKADLVEAVLRQPELFSNEPSSSFDPVLIGADSAVHTASRAILQPFFSSEKMAALGDFAATTWQDLTADLTDRSSFDFVTELAAAFTQKVGGQFIGFTGQECKHLRERLPAHPCDAPFFEPLAEIIAETLRSRPKATKPSTLLDTLIALEHTEELTFSAVVSLTKTLWTASTVTSSSVMASAAHYLLTHPTVAAQLRTCPEQVNPFVEELLRLAAPLAHFGRRTTRPVTLGGCELPGGACVLVSLAAANRDPDHYSDPGALDLNRSPSRHLSFGGGIHACLGAYLARLEIRLMVRWLLNQENTLRLVSPGSLPEYYPHFTFRALMHMAVTLPPLVRP